MTRLWLAVAASALAASAAAAQTDARLVAAVRLAQQGDRDSARAAVQRVLVATAPADSTYPQALYAAAVVAADVREREHALQRVVVEYPLSAWADDALLMLVENDYADGNLPAAARDVERIRRDFPASPSLGRAALWAARTYFDMHNQSAACTWVTLGLAHPGKDREVNAALGFQAPRCGAVAVARPDTAAARFSHDSVPADSGRVPPPPAVAAAPTPSPATAVPPDSQPSAEGHFRVQLAAAGTAAEADQIARGLRGRGIDVDVTPEKGYFKVRTGQFATRRQAQAEANRLRARLGGGPFVVQQ